MENIFLCLESLIKRLEGVEEFWTVLNTNRRLLLTFVLSLCVAEQGFYSATHRILFSPRLA